jgi:hypothetical protein
MKTKAPPTPAPARETVSFGVRLDSDLIDRLDAYAAMHQHKRGWALARAVDAGLGALGVPPTTGKTTNAGTGNSGRGDPSTGAQDAELVAEAVVKRLGHHLAPALVEAGRRIGLSESGEIGKSISHAADLLQTVIQRTALRPAAEAREELAAVIGVAIHVLTGRRTEDFEVTARNLPRACNGGDHLRSLARRLSEARTARGMSVQEAAADAGVEPVLYRRAERAVEVTSETVAVLLAWALRGTPES